MVFVGDGIEHTNYGRINKGLAGRHERVESPKEKKIKNSIFNDMSSFFEGEIERTHIEQRCSRQRREQEDDGHPAQGGEPIASETGPTSG
jgi:hypothetical protein